MQPIRTVHDLLHAVGNSLSIISSHAQYLVGKNPPLPNSEDLRIVWDEAHRAAELLKLVPQRIGELVLVETSADAKGCSDGQE